MVLSRPLGCSPPLFTTVKTRYADAAAAVFAIGLSAGFDKFKDVPSGC